MMVGTGAAAVGDAVKLSRHAASLGFAGALVLPPFYYKGVSDAGVVAYIGEIAAATGQSEPAVRSLLFRAKKALKAKLERG